MFKQYILTSIFILLLVYNNFSQVVINEYSCANLNTIQDNYSSYEDWIEIYNPGATAFDLTGYYLSDKPTYPTKWVFPSISVPANGYLMVFASGRDEISGGYAHTNFKLTQTKPEYIVLSNNIGTIIEQILIEPNQKDHSRGRTTNGAATWSLFTTPTPNAANNNAMQNYATKPIFDQNPGLYAGTISLNITSPDPNVTIRYTTNGSTPTAASPVVSGPISINNTTVVRAISISSTPSIPASFVETNTYFINDVHTVPVLSISGNQVSNLLGGSYLEPEGALEYFNSSQVLVDEATGYFNKHGNDSWAYDQRGIDFVAQDQLGTNYALQDQIFRSKTRDEYQRLIIKAAANDNYPFENGGAHIRDAYVHSLSQIGELKIDERSYEPCILYVNGQYWGVYDMREKVDDSDFTDYYYNQDVPYIQYLKTWGGTWAEYGGPQAITDWNTLKNYILSNDMSIPANFDFVSAQYSWKSLVDYIVLNSYVVCSDWLNWNTSWWRGLDTLGTKEKWRYTLWDMDATFGHYINYTGVPSTAPDADPCNADNLPDPGGQGHVPILNALMANPIFEQYYISRYADLSNTIFSCDFMISHLDSLIDIIQPEMQRQINKWGGTLAVWQSNVQDLRDFINDRCAEITDGMIDCYNLTGPFQITILVDPPGSGKVEINSLVLNSYPWTGTYYGGINTLLYANDAPGWDFDYWELANNTVSPTINDIHVTSDFVSDDVIIAHFKTTLNVDIGNDTTICAGDSLFLDAGHTGATFIWSDGSHDSTLWVTQAGTYSVTVNEGLAVGYADIVVSITDIDIISDINLCNGGTAQLNVTGGESYSWSPINTLSNPNIANPVATPTQTTTYSVTVTDIVGCQYTDDVTVYVSENIDLNIVANNYSVCPNEQVVVTVQVSGGMGAPYYIYLNGNTTSNPFFIDVLGDTTFTVSAEDMCGTIANEDVTITTNPIPTINISTNVVEGCLPLKVSFHEDGINNIYHQWNFGDDLVSLNHSPTHIYNYPGIYTITVDVENIFGCKNSATIDSMITVYPKPTSKFIADPEIVSVIKPIIFFDNLSLLADTNIWDFGDGSYSTIENPYHTYPTYPTGNYNTQLVVITQNNCKDTSYLTVTIQDEYTFYAPTAFSPDRDGINDYFKVYGNGIGERNFKMIIYDRWGEIVFETEDYQLGWDGKINSGDYGTPGVYTWLVYYQNDNGVSISKTGAVTLLK